MTHAERWTLVLAVVVVAIAGLLPVLVVIAESVTVEGYMSFESYNALLSSPRQWRWLGNTVLLGVLVASVSMAVGLPLGLLLAKTDLPFRSALAVLFTVPLLLPPYILALAWFHVLGRGGLLTQWFSPALGELTHEVLFGLPGSVLVLSSSLMPVVLLMTIAFTRTVHPLLEEAALMTAPWRSVLTGITLPLIRPGVLLGGLLVFLLATGEFAVPMFLRFDVYAVESFTQFAAFYQPGAATAFAVPLAFVAFVALTLERVHLRDRTYEVRFASPRSGLLTVPLGPLRPLVMGAVLLAWLLIIGLPLGSLVAASAVGGNYSEALGRSWDALLRSVAYATTGATLLTVLGFFIGYIVQRRSLPGWRSVDSLTILLFALPSTVIGVGLVTLWNRPLLGAIYGTPLLVLIGYVAQYIALTSRISVAGLSSVPRSMEEAAQLSGASWFRRVGLIVAPLTGRALGAGWLIGYLFCLRDTGLSMMIYPAGGDPLPVRTFTMMANGAPALVAALCVIMVAAALVPLLIVGLIFAGASRENAQAA